LALGPEVYPATGGRLQEREETLSRQQLADGRDLHQDQGTVGIPVLAIDKEGQTIDFLLTAHRDKKAAKRFLKKAVSQHELPDKITLDKSGANAAAIEALIEETGCEIEIRPKMRLSPTPTFSQRKIIYRLVLMTLLFWGVPLSCVSEIWAHERQTNDSNLRVFNELRL
jgi:hypothetical protein